MREGSKGAIPFQLGRYPALAASLQARGRISAGLHSALLARQGGASGSDALMLGGSVAGRFRGIHACRTRVGKAS
ncbi:MAG: hypothetical protein WCI01_01505 [Chlorobiaceae bacterium]